MAEGVCIVSIGSSERLARAGIPVPEHLQGSDFKLYIVDKTASLDLTISVLVNDVVCRVKPYLDIATTDGMALRYITNRFQSCKRQISCTVNYIPTNVYSLSLRLDSGWISEVVGMTIKMFVVIDPVAREEYYGELIYLNGYLKRRVSIKNRKHAYEHQLEDYTKQNASKEKIAAVTKLLRKVNEELQAVKEEKRIWLAERRLARLK